MTDPQYMTYGQARARLRRYFRIRKLVAELEEFGGYRPHDHSLLLISHQKPAPGDSAQEAEMVRRLDLFRSVAEEAAALARLSVYQQKFAELRWGDGLPFRPIARELHRALGAMSALERATLAAFIAAMGYIPRERNDDPRAGKERPAS